MEKQNLKLVSTRIDPRTIEKIDQFCRNARYWKRNTVINGILTAVMDLASEKDIYNLIRYHPTLNKCITKLTIDP